LLQAVAVTTGKQRQRLTPASVRGYDQLRENESGKAMTDGKHFISGELRRRVEELEQQEEREPSEVLVTRYATGRRLEQFSPEMGRHAGGLGIREEDIPGLISAA
jgi:hypothetical protein